MTVTLHARLSRDADGYPPFDAEELSADDLGDHTYRLVDTPAFAFGLASGDVVRAHSYPDEPGLWIDALVEAGEHSAVRVVLLGGSPPEPLHDLVAKHGLKLENSVGSAVLTIDVPPSSDLAGLWADLVDPDVRDRWDAGVGVLSEEHQRRGVVLERPPVTPS
jgi:hypothetical protein